jgi:putative FmdB family regulatory protein
MPTYEYRCRSCGHEFEEFQPMSADPLIICPKCAEPSLKRLMSSGAGLLFKGSGFYLTDYKKSGASSSSAQSSPSAVKPESKQDSKPGAKPESGTPPKPKPDSSTGKENK